MRLFWLRIMGAIVIEFVIAGVFLGILTIFGMTDTILGSYAPSMIFAGVIGATLSIAILLYATRWGGLTLENFGFEWNSHHARFSAVAAALILALTASYMLVIDQIDFREVMFIPPQWGVILAGILGALSVLHEEILSRGYILTMLNKRYGMVLALILSAIIFMLIHIPTRGISYLLVSWLGTGFVFGYVYLKSGSLWTSLAVHATHNFAADLLLYSGNGFAIVQFEPPLGAAGQLPLRFLLGLTIVALTYLWYGRGERFLKPAPHFDRQRSEQLHTWNS